MRFIRVALTSVLLSLIFISCRQELSPSPVATFSSDAARSTVATQESLTTTIPTETASIPAEVTPVPTRLGANYVLQLPREDTVPAGWAMDRRPDFRVPDRQPGDTYRFACLDLPARSIGTASVGYRNLEGMPSVTIEYVVYDSAESAAAALADMKSATESCGEFELGAGDSATTARLSIMEFQPFGEESFAASLESTNDINGELTTHLLKILQDNIVIGITHATFTADTPPDNNLTILLADTAVRNLSAQGNEY